MRGCPGHLRSVTCLSGPGACRGGSRDELAECVTRGVLPDESRRTLACSRAIGGDCREGTNWLEQMLVKMETGEADKREIPMLEEVTRQIEGHTICALGDAAAWPVQVGSLATVVS